MFWIMIREAPLAEGLPMANAIGPYLSLEDAETLAGKIGSPGTFTIIDGTNKIVSKITIEPIKVNVQRTK